MKKTTFSYLLLLSFFLLIGHHDLNAMKTRSRDKHCQGTLEPATKKQKTTPEHVIILHRLPKTNPNPQVHKKNKSLYQKKCFFDCEMCGKSLSSYTAFKYHIMAHKGITPHKCECGKGYTQKGNLKKHMENCLQKKEDISLSEILNETSSLEENQLLCNNCDRLFATSDSRKAHEIGCEKKFVKKKRVKTLSQVMVLKNEKHDNPPIKKGKTGDISKTTIDPKYICHVCGKILCNKYGLTNHLMLHTGERPYKCHLCPKKFIQNSNFKKHVKYCIKKSKLSDKDFNSNISSEEIHPTSYSSDDEKSENADLIEFFNNEDLSEWLECL